MDNKSDWRPGPTVCRCCLSEGCYKDISTEYFWMGKKEVYADMLSETLDLTIQYAQTGGPNSHSRLICEPCISRLRDASDFKRQVKECEQTFMQYLNPSTSINTTVPANFPEKEELKIEVVKQELPLSDDDVADTGYADDDDDLDDEPLMNLASKTPKKESVDVMELLDITKAPKRKATAKSKTTPAKKTKLKVDKPSASKPKPEKKKKAETEDPVRNNAEILLRRTTAHPFRVNNKCILCVYCQDLFEDPDVFRSHMNEEHDTFSARVVFHNLPKVEFVKADLTDLRCRLCSEKFDAIETVAKHLVSVHKEPLDFDVKLGVMPYKLKKDVYMCAVCSKTVPSIFHLNRHTITHFLTYVCHVCGKSYIATTGLLRHLRSKHQQYEVPCRRCGKIFPNMEAKDRHHRTEKSCMLYSCYKCRERFHGFKARQRHMELEHGVNKRTDRCADCNMTFTSGSAYYEHFKLHHSGDCAVCKHCGLKFATRYRLQRHMKFANWLVVARHNARVVLKYTTAYPFRIPHLAMVCVYCCDSFETSQDYRNHISSEHATFNINTAFAHINTNYTEYIKADCTDLRCRLCATPLDTLVEAAKHLASYHNKEIKTDYEIGIQIFKFDHKSWECALCGEKHPTIRELSRHTSKHYHKYTCETCGKSYVNLESLKKHRKFSHTDEKICVRCKEIFANTGARREHMLSSEKCWPFRCSTCGLRFIKRRDKCEHNIEVHGQARKEYKCPECPMVFDKWGPYRAHFILTHTDKVFACSYCDLQFDNKSSLQEHIVSHTKEKLFACSVCSKMFSRKKNLIQHSWIHSEVKRFECKLCVKQFNQRVSWKTHMKSHHPDLVDFK
ncbi:unnamed protein product [Leptosia nina]|uniref:Uncharacterized protein n=1 Tax=Leptosia nina TaxID=320188 RepID=A0AAV1JY52_9NEOP